MSRSTSAFSASPPAAAAAAGDTPTVSSPPTAAPAPPLTPLKRSNAIASADYIATLMRGLSIQEQRENAAAATDAALPTAAPSFTNAASGTVMADAAEAPGSPESTSEASAEATAKVAHLFDLPAAAGTTAASAAPAGDDDSDNVEVVPIPPSAAILFGRKYDWESATVAPDEDTSAAAATAAAVAVAAAATTAAASVAADAAVDVPESDSQPPSVRTSDLILHVPALPPLAPEFAFGAAPASASASATERPTALFYDPRCLLHQANYNHVEGPQRLLRSFERLVNTGLWEQCAHVAVGGPTFGSFGPLRPAAVAPSSGASSQAPAVAVNATAGDGDGDGDDDNNLPPFTRALKPRLSRPLVVRPLFSAPAPLLGHSAFTAVHDAALVERVSSAPRLDYCADEPDSETEGDEVYYPDCKYLDQDTYVNAFTAASTRIAVTGTVACTRAVASGAARTAFALIRPPGHHAAAATQSGFCLYNNVAVAVRDAQRRYPDTVKRVLVLDWDVHHGDGTQAIFDDDPSVLFVSLHRYHKGFFPGTGASDEIGAGPGRGFTMNIPMPGPKFGDTEYLAAMDALVLPVVRQFAPDLIFVSAGMDLLAGDPLGGMDVTPACLGAIVRRLRDPVLGAGGRVVAVLEGGYDPCGVAEGVCAVVAALGDITQRADDPATESAATAAAIAAAAVAQAAAGGGRDRDSKGREFRLREAGRAVSDTAKKLAPFWPAIASVAKSIDKFGLVKAAEMVQHVFAQADAAAAAAAVAAAAGAAAGGTANSRDAAMSGAKAGARTAAAVGAAPGSKAAEPTPEQAPQKTAAHGRAQPSQ